MAIYTLKQLRDTAPDSLKNLPDDVLICHYMKNTGEKLEAFQFFGVDKPLIFSCETLVDLYDVYLPANGLASGAAAAAGFAAAGLAGAALPLFSRLVITTAIIS